MGQLIILDVDPNDGNNTDGIKNLDMLLQQSILKFNSKAEVLIDNLTKDQQNHLSRDYYLDKGLNKIERHIIQEGGYHKIVLNLERDFKKLLNAYVPEKQTQHVLNLFKDKTKRVEDLQETDPCYGLNFKYLNGHLGNIVLIRYYIFHKDIVLPKNELSLLLYCFSIEVFDKKKIPLCFSINIDAMIDIQKEEINQRQDQEKENGFLSDFIQQDESITIEDLVKKLKNQNQITVIPFKKPQGPSP